MTDTKRRAADIQRIQRRTDVWDLRCQGWTQVRIAQAMKVNQSTISRDLKWAADNAIANLTEAVRQTKIEQVHQLGRIADEALQAWERSKDTNTTVSKRTKGSKRFGSEEITQQVKEQVGDARFLSTAMAAFKDIRKILGADAPLRAEISGPGGGALEIEQADHEPERVAEILGILVEVGAIQTRADSPNDAQTN